MFYKASGSGRAALRGRQRPLLARWIPAESASPGSNGRLLLAEIALK
ncbi:hypothetical protein LOF13_27605 [Klebsiella pneumoniae subsp. pneumoniae]|nr:hypothetical protein LOF13_27605 [Klebsiella pneumoniae subsp. pneumoniae]